MCVLIPAAVLHVMLAVLNDPVIAEESELLSGPHWREIRLVSRRQRVVTSPVAISAVFFSTMASCLAPGNPKSSRNSRPSCHQPKFAAFRLHPLFPWVFASGSPSPPGLLSRRGLKLHRHLRLMCVKYRHTELETDEFRATGGNFAKFFDVQNKKFATVSCKRWGYAEIYKGNTSGLSNIFDFFAGG